MSSPLSVACPNCDSKLKVPVELTGKTIKCKACGTAFKVPAAPVRAKALPADLARPAQAKPAPPPPPPPAADAPIGLAADEDDGPVTNYGVVQDDSHIPRCPRCIAVLEPPDTKICLNCGYDLLARIRHTSKKVYALTTWDYVKHLAPGVLWFLVGAAVLGGAIFCAIKMRSWMEGSFFDQEEKDAITQKTKFYVEPFCFNVWLLLFGVFVMWKSGRFAIKRLFFDWRPPETIKKDD